MKKTLVHWSGMHRKLEEGADRNIQGWKKGTLANEDCGNAVVIDHNICLRRVTVWWFGITRMGSTYTVEHR